MKGKERPLIGLNPRSSALPQGLLSALRDFGVLQGAVNKKNRARLLSRPVVLHISFLSETAPAIRSETDRVAGLEAVLLQREGVERFLFEAHQRNLLEYHVAGSVTRLTFPAETLEEYANVLAKR